MHYGEVCIRKMSVMEVIMTRFYILSSVATGREHPEVCDNQGNSWKVCHLIVFVSLMRDNSVVCCLILFIYYYYIAM